MYSIKQNICKYVSETVHGNKKKTPEPKVVPLQNAILGMWLRGKQLIVTK